jgi:hypothetical protein
MKRFGPILIAVLIVSAVVLTISCASGVNLGDNPKSDNFYFGLTYGQNTVEGAEILMDKVQSYTNLFIIDSSAISENETALNEICNYAA